MGQQMTDALKTAKTLNTELVQIENRVAFEEKKLEGLKAQSELLQTDIDKKRTEYELFMGSRDAETKKLRNDLTLDREKFESEKTEFVNILQDLQKQKSKMEFEISNFATEKAVHTQAKENLKQCIIAIQRAVMLIGL